MRVLFSVRFTVDGVEKSISSSCGDVTRFDRPISILTTSAFVGSYAATPGTVFLALAQVGIYANQLAADPAFDLRDPCHIWLSRELGPCGADIRRIGCIELIGAHTLWQTAPEAEQSMIHSIQAYFHMLDIASLYGTDVTTIALPLLGSGDQHIGDNLLLTPLINECIAFLKRNSCAKNICFVEKNPEKAERIATCLENSLRFLDTEAQESQKDQKKLAFISYSSKDKNIADNLCAKLEQQGIKVWYAPRDVHGPYANAIANAIDKAKYFIVILSQNSIASEHVLNEIDLAFQNLNQGMQFKPLKIDDALFTPAFKYYLSRQHWMDATIPPLEARLNEFVRELLNDRQRSD